MVPLSEGGTVGEGVSRTESSSGAPFAGVKSAVRPAHSQIRSASFQ